MRFVRVQLEVAAHRLPMLADFYSRDLGFDVDVPGGDRLSFAIGETTIEFVAASGEPFYHFALLVPGNRFGEAHEWGSARTTLLGDPGSGASLFHFESWDAEACYFEDPGGNIVELIAHRGIDDTPGQADFRPTELVGLSELGLVGDPAAMTAPLAERLGLELWDGSVREPGSLAFVGERARTLILSPPERGWMPTRRAAERHRVDALVASEREGEVELERSCYRIRSVRAP